MKKPIAIDKALLDKNLLGAALGDPASWLRWVSTLRAAFALPMSDEDRTAFAEVSGNRAPPTARVRELWMSVGRRSGKSKIAAALAVYAACFVPRRLAAGEIGTVLVLAASSTQAQTVFQYCLGFLNASPILKHEIASTTASKIRLTNGTTIAVHANSYRTVRGKTLLATIFDEVSFWRDADSALPDVETYRAVLPSLVTTNGMLIAISSPYRKTGILFEKHRDHFGQDDPNVLVVQGASRLFNPTLDQAVISAACASDPESARAEWEGEFRSDISAFLDDEIIEACVDYARPLELPPRSDIVYKAFVDPSGGRHDAFTLGIAHKVGESYVIDVVRGRYPPFDPNAVVDEFASLLKSYKLSSVIGDNYSAEWAVTAFRSAGILYERSELNKSQLYLEALPHFMRCAISLPDHPKLIKELRLLERRTSCQGKDIVDHGRNGSDDHANALVGSLWAAVSNAGYDPLFRWVDGLSRSAEAEAEQRDEWRRQQHFSYINSFGRR